MNVWEIEAALLLLQWEFVHRTLHSILLAQLCFGSADTKNPMLDFWFATGKGWTRDTQLPALWSCLCRPHKSIDFNYHKQCHQGMLLTLSLPKLQFLLFLWF